VSDVVIHVAADRGYLSIGGQLKLAAGTELRIRWASRESGTPALETVVRGGGKIGNPGGSVTFERPSEPRVS
jgi:hypothetical protein